MTPSLGVSLSSPLGLLEVSKAVTPNGPCQPPLRSLLLHSLPGPGNPTHQFSCVSQCPRPCRPERIMGLGVRHQFPKALQDDHWSRPSQGILVQLLCRNLQVTFSQVMWGWTSQCPWCWSREPVALQVPVLCSESKTHGA